MKNIYIVLAISLLLTACQQQPANKEKKETANSYVLESAINIPGATKIKFLNSEVYNFGVVKKGTVIKHSFIIKNIGNIPLIIAGANSSCGCTVASFPHKPILPGKMDSITAVFSTQFVQPGMENKVISVTSNAEKTQNYLTVLGQVR